MFTRKNILITIIGILLFSGFVKKDTDIYFEISKSIDIFGRIYKEVTLNYVDELDPQEFMLAGIEGMLQSLDPYTNFIDGNNQKDMDIIIKGKYGGIGATIGVRNETITVVDLIEGYSAQRQGIRIGDIISKIDETIVTKENYDELNNLLKGDPGTTVKITIQREGLEEPIFFNLIREEIEIKNLSYYGFYPENSSNAYLKLSGFSRTAGEEVKKALIELKGKKNIESIVLDLRGNPGGLLDAAIDVSEKFLSKGQLVVSVKGRDSAEVKNHFSTEEPVAGIIRLAVLIDEGSASASEIVAGAIQDHDRGLIVGANSFGKGLVQTLIPLSYNTSLKMTTARYYTPSGRSIQKIDYSDKNKVFELNKKLAKSEFKTDKNRKVFSAGGIQPDSIVNNRSKSHLVQRLLADGMFFKFATYYYNEKSETDFKKFNSDFLLKEFREFIKQQKFEFVSPVEKLIEQLKVAAQQENLNGVFIEMLDKSKAQIDESHSKEMEKYKDDIVGSIREELAARSDGRIGRIVESLINDVQLRTALSILTNDNVYSKFLK
ncbi:MAG: S41 family peptidase [Melioribacteraceae bacterium]|nr:S41 family peptidase [Melioribacteraceae bacterium]